MVDRSLESVPPATTGSIQVVEHLAEHLGTEPTEVDFTLHEYVDTEALDSLLDSATDEVVVAFAIEEKLVTIANDGTIEITETTGE